jgi:hypothetical protein
LIKILEGRAAKPQRRPAFLEVVYENALCHELSLRGALNASCSPADPPPTPWRLCGLAALPLKLGCMVSAQRPHAID